MKDMTKTLSIIKQNVTRLYDAQQQKKKFDNYYNEVRKKEQLIISNFMFSNLESGQNSFEIKLDEGVEHYTNHVSVRVTNVRKKKIFWNLDKLKSRLSKKQYNSVVEKEYTVNDMSGLVSYLKECNVDPKKFKKFIDVSEELNDEKINNLYEMGEVDLGELKGCYEIEYGDPYIRLTELKNGTEV